MITELLWIGYVGQGVEILSNLNVPLWEDQLTQPQHRHMNYDKYCLANAAQQAHRHADLDSS